MITVTYIFSTHEYWIISFTLTPQDMMGNSMGMLIILSMVSTLDYYGKSIIASRDCVSVPWLINHNRVSSDTFWQPFNYFGRKTHFCETASSLNSVGDSFNMNSRWINDRKFHAIFETAIKFPLNIISRRFSFFPTLSNSCVFKLWFKGDSCSLLSKSRQQSHVFAVCTPAKYTQHSPSHNS